ncbi:MAG: FadR family transcriptional regulator, partial [Betaproteobacteria bacterium]|nr:FadR family transcriptional regulator [Betaproteobacteria bacterium]
MNHSGIHPAPLRRAQTLAAALMQSLGERIRDGRLAAGDKLPPESVIMAEYGVSRTVVREALSKLQAAGKVQTRHGVGTFITGSDDAAPFRISSAQMGTLQEVIAVLELRIGLETESAALAAQRRTERNLEVMRKVLADFGRAVDEGRDAVSADLRLHLEIARATQNAHFVELMTTLGSGMIPRARLDAPAQTPELDTSRRAYLQRVNAEHQVHAARGEAGLTRGAIAAIEEFLVTAGRHPVDADVQH